MIIGFSSGIGDDNSEWTVVSTSDTDNDVIVISISDIDGNVYAIL